ncbi:MAG: hypothetical protein ACWA5W_09695 [Phycisphaerales bacterium]
MSDRICYIQRTDRGAALRGVRLIGPHTNDSWSASPSNDPTLANESIRSCAAWIRDRLANMDKSKSLGVVCLDADGGVCSWVKPEDADEAVLDEAISDQSSDEDRDELEPETHTGLAERFPKLPMEVSFEQLSSEQTSVGSRIAMMGIPDIPGRLIKDQLDSMGIVTGCFTTVWHAMAYVWDSSDRLGSHDSQRIVASDTPISASIVLDGDAGRLLWTWSRSGELIAAGSARVQTTTRNDDHTNQSHPSAKVRPEDIARLCSDWLGWSSQLGVSPSRVVIVGHPADESVGSTLPPSPSESENQHADRPAGLDAAQIGMHISKAWPEATVDLIEHEDPIGETLRQLSLKDRLDGLKPLSSLNDRPGRSHRSMYRWAGFALLMISAMFGFLAYQLFVQGQAIGSQRAQVETQRIAALDQYDPQLVTSPIPTMDLQAKLAQIRKSQGPLRITRAKPILEELDTISYIFGIPGIEIDTIRLNNTTGSVTIRVDEIAQAEQINQSLSAIAGSHLRWNQMVPKNKGTKIEASFTARWISGEDES